MKYKQRLVELSAEFAKLDNSLFVGHGVLEPNAFYGTLSQVPREKLLEMPLAESLMAGVACGLAVDGWKPCLVIQRMDFILIAADAILNHMALVPDMSNNQYTCPIWIRTCVGSSDKKFDCGLQHNKEFINLFQDRIATIKLTNDPEDFCTLRNYIVNLEKPVLSVEWKDLYDTEI